VDPSGNPTYQATVVDDELDRVYALGFEPAPEAVYAAGDGLQVTAPPLPRVNPTIWKVRKSSNGNLGSWITQDSFSLATTTYASARGITFDAAGNVYVCGEAAPKRGGLRWIVRKLAVGGSWTTVSELFGQGDASAKGVCFFPGNAVNSRPAVLAVGSLNNKWTVMRSQDAGASWTSVDSWSPGAKVAATASKVACDSAGNLYVVGSRGTWLYPTGWVVRKSPDGGGSWTTVLDVAEGAYSVAGSVATDGAGNIWITGYTMNPTGTPRWTVLPNGVQRSFPENNSAFLQSRQLPFGEAYSKARGIATDAAGDNVFITGEVRWEDGTSRVGLQRYHP
jgi:hypothetical protein